MIWHMPSDAIETRQFLPRLREQRPKIVLNFPNVRKRSRNESPIRALLHPYFHQSSRCIIRKEFPIHVSLHDGVIGRILIHAHQLKFLPHFFNKSSRVKIFFRQQINGSAMSLHLDELPRASREIIPGKWEMRFHFRQVEDAGWRCRLEPDALCTHQNHSRGRDAPCMHNGRPVFRNFPEACPTHVALHPRISQGNAAHPALLPPIP
jgi:hypothetical protein